MASTVQIKNLSINPAALPYPFSNVVGGLGSLLFVGTAADVLALVPDIQKGFLVAEFTDQELAGAVALPAFPDAADGGSPYDAKSYALTNRSYITTDDDVTITSAQLIDGVAFVQLDATAVRTYTLPTLAEIDAAIAALDPPGTPITTPGSGGRQFTLVNNINDPIYPVILQGSADFMHNSSWVVLPGQVATCTILTPLEVITDGVDAPGTPSLGVVLGMPSPAGSIGYVGDEKLVLTPRINLVLVNLSDPGIIKLPNPAYSQDQTVIIRDIGGNIDVTALAVQGYDGDTIYGPASGARVASVTLDEPYGTSRFYCDGGAWYSVGINQL